MPGRFSTAQRPLRWFAGESAVHKVGGASQALLSQPATQ
jgi:hypothetical protein